MRKFFPFLLVFYEITTYLANDMYLPALPQISVDLGVTTCWAQLTLTLWFMGAASMQLVLGPLSDRYGRRPILLLGGCFFIISLLICASTSNIYFFLASRFFQGCAVCSVVVAGYAAVHELYDHREAIRVLALMSAVTVLAPAFGPVLGSVLMLFSGWRLIFELLAVWAIIALVFLWKWMPETQVFLAQEPFSWAVLVNQYKRILKNKSFMLNMLAFCFLFTGMILWIVSGPFLVLHEFHFTSMFVFSVFQLIIFTGYLVSSRLVKYGLAWWGASRLISIGLLIALLGGILSGAVAWVYPTSYLSFILALTLFTSGVALAFSSLHRLTIESSDEPMGARMAVFSTLMSLFGVFASALISSIDQVSSSQLGFMVMVGALLACLMRCVAVLRNTVQ